MSYLLNTSVYTHKVNFASTGPFSGPIYSPCYILSRPLWTIVWWQIDAYLCIKNVIVCPSTYLHKNYMSGTGYYIENDGTEYDIVSFDVPHFNELLSSV